MNKSQDPQDANAPGQPEERRQTMRERAPADQERESAGAAAGEGSPTDADRTERIRRRAYQLWEDGGRQDGQADDDWHRAAQDLDREDADLQRFGSAARNAGQNRT